MRALNTASLVGSLGGLGAEQAATMVAAVLGAAVTVLVAAATFAATQAAARRDRRARVYADALRAVSDYNEGPYRVRRRDGSAEQRAAVTGALNDVKSRIDFSQALLQLHAPTKVATAYDTLARCARAEAGAQMKEAWTKLPTATDAQVNLDLPYLRPQTDAARERAVAVMRASLGLRWWNPVSLSSWWRS